MLLTETLPIPIEERTKSNQFYLAEQLTATELRQNIDTATHVRAEDWHPERNALKIAWAQVEFGLSHEISDEESDTAFEQAERSLNVLHHEKPQYQMPSDTIDGYVLRAFLPAFKARRQRDELGAITLRGVRHGLGEALCQTYDIDASRTDSELLRMTTMAAHLRNITGANTASVSDLGFMFPASTRERVPRSKEGAAANHHFYLVDQGQKVALANKSSRKRQPEVGIVTLPALAQSALTSYKLENDISPADAMLMVAELLEDDFLQPQKLQITERAALDAVTAGIVQTGLRHAIKLRRAGNSEL